MSVAIDDPDWNVPHPPPFYRLLSKSILIPITISYLLFYAASVVVKRYFWGDYKGFKQYRLRNLSICLLHSLICGVWVFGFAVTHTHVMFNDPVFYFEPYMGIIITVTIGYMIHDALDMLRYEISRWSIELFFHHLATAFVMSVAACGERFTVYAYWSLLMEINSIFLHLRTIFQLSGANETHPNLFRLIKQLNISTFMVFRFAVQLWQLRFVIVWREHYHWFYFACGFYGGLIFLFLNIVLFLRVLASDRLLWGSLGKYLAINRDDQKSTKVT